MFLSVVINCALFDMILGFVFDYLGLIDMQIYR